MAEGCVKYPPIQNQYDKETLLYKLNQAAERCDLATLKSLLERLPEDDICKILETSTEDNGEITTPLLTAAKYNSVTIVEQLLVKIGVYVDQEGTLKLDADNLVYNVTPLYCAAFNGNIEMLRILLERFGAEINHKSLYNETAVRAASEKGHFHAVKYLVEMGADIHLTHSYNGSNCLLAALYNGHHKVAAFLLDQKANPFVEDIDGFTAVHLAAKFGFQDILETVYKIKADQAFHFQDNRGFSPIEIAAENQQNPIELFKFLDIVIAEEIREYELYGASLIFARNIDAGLDCLSTAMEMRYEDSSNVIEKKELINIQSNTAVYGKKPEARTITELKSIRPIMEDECKIQALLVMERTLGENVVLNPEEVIKFLMFKAESYKENQKYVECMAVYTKALDICDKSNKSMSVIIEKFVTVIAEMQHEDILVEFKTVSYLFTKCSNDLQEEWFKMTNDDYLPAIKNAEKHLTTDIRNSLALLAILKKIVDSKPNLSFKVFLHQSVRELIELDIKDHTHEYSILHFAACNHVSQFSALKSPSFEIFQLLVEQGAKLNELDVEGNTPLHILASYNGRDDETVSDIIGMLIEYGVHVDPRNNHNARPLDVANPVVLDRLKMATRKVGLKCRAAQAVKYYHGEIYRKILPNTLSDFVDRH